MVCTAWLMALLVPLGGKLEGKMFWNLEGDEFCFEHTQFTQCGLIRTLHVNTEQNNLKEDSISVTRKGKGKLEMCGNMKTNRRVS